MDNRTRRYKKGLEGNKPGWIWLDDKGQRAQEAGYRDHLKNQDLADKIRRNQETETYDGRYDFSSDADKPFTRGQLLFWASVLLGSGLILLASMISADGENPAPWYVYIMPGLIDALLLWGGIRVLSSFLRR